MIERAVYYTAFSNEWGRQMRFIVGPRQSGKTTIAKLKLISEKTDNLYYLWDLRSVRNRYKENELFFTGDMMSSNRKLWVCFDEIHKMPRWKNILKGIFDQTENNYNFIITGSAKLEIMRRTGDSLSGRYFTFRLFPLSLGELKNARELHRKIPKSAGDFIKRVLDTNTFNEDALSSLLEFGGFPEPFQKQSRKFLSKWADAYLDRIINEDILVLTRITEVEYLYDIYRLLFEMTSSPVSMQSLASHIELNVPTVKNYLKRLADFYLIFKISPYSKNIKRSLLKAGKYYLYDWTRIADSAKRFENFIACELYSLISLWNDETGKDYSLNYIRTKEKKETDFLILKENKPWMLIEVKYSDGPVDNHHIATSRVLGDIPVVQVCRENKIAVWQKKNVLRISASRFF